MLQPAKKNHMIVMIELRGSETIAGDAIIQQQQVETTESQSDMEGSEAKIASDAECANGQVTAETKLASSEQLTGDNSTQPAIFSTENQMSEENKPQVNAEMVENTKSRAAESRLSLTTGALAGQENTSDTTGETRPSPSQVQTLTPEVDTEVIPVVNNHQSEQVSLALLVFFSELLFNFSYRQWFSSPQEWYKQLCFEVNNRNVVFLLKYSLVGSGWRQYNIV